MLDGATLYVASDGGTIYSFEAQTGKVRWKQPLDGSVDSAPAVEDGAVCVTTEKSTVDALCANDGTPGWKYDDGGLMYSPTTIAP